MFNLSSLIFQWQDYQYFNCDWMRYKLQMIFEIPEERFTWITEARWTQEIGQTISLQVTTSAHNQRHQTKRRSKFRAMIGPQFEERIKPADEFCFLDVRLYVWNVGLPFAGVARGAAGRGGGRDWQSHAAVWRALRTVRLYCHYCDTVSSVANHWVF